MPVLKFPEEPLFGGRTFLQSDNESVIGVLHGELLHLALSGYFNGSFPFAVWHEQNWQVFLAGPLFDCQLLSRLLMTGDFYLRSFFTCRDPHPVRFMGDADDKGFRGLFRCSRFAWLTSRQTQSEKRNEHNQKLRLGIVVHLQLFL